MAKVEMRPTTSPIWKEADDSAPLRANEDLEDSRRMQPSWTGYLPRLARNRMHFVLCAILVAVLGAIIVNAVMSRSQRVPYGFELPASTTQAIEGIRRDLENIVEYNVNGLGKGQGWKRAARICDLFGPRQVGTQNLERAIDDIASQLGQEQFDKVYFEEVAVPRWNRGTEALHLLLPTAAASKRKLAMLGFARSVGTGDGIEADVLVVRDLDELVANAALAKGRIVVFYWPFDNYAKGRTLRSNCASFVAKVGGVAAGLSSLASFSLASPHTGTVKYRIGQYTRELQKPFVPDFFLGNYTDIPHIPAFALAVEDAAMLDRLYRQGEVPRLHLEMGARDGGTGRSRNLVAEITGFERPDEVVTIGAHLDSWDVSCGAQDDLGPAVVQWQVMSTLRALGLRARRTVRMVLFTAEEIGSLGGWEHFRLQEGTGATDLLSAIFDIDSGIFHWCGLSVSGDAATVATLRLAAESLAGIGAQHVDLATFRHASNMFMFPLRIPTLAPNQAPIAEVPPGRLAADGSWRESLSPFQGGYWFFHHSAGDRMPALLPSQIDRAAATVAVHVFSIAMLPRLLSRGEYRLATEQAPCAAPPAPDPSPPP